MYKNISVMRIILYLVCLHFLAFYFHDHSHYTLIHLALKFKHKERWDKKVNHKVRWELFFSFAQIVV